jgi:hypothetical protein
MKDKEEPCCEISREMKYLRKKIRLFEEKEKFLENN